MKTQHTPGPWAAQIGARHVDVEADDWIITETDTHKSDSPPRAQCIANARLIAAAPDLLEAAAFARDLAMRMTAKADIPYCAEFAAIAQDLDAAIAKAIVAAA